MPAAPHDSARDRRAAPPVARHGGRRWRDDPDLADGYERLLLLVSRDVYGLRQHQEWSQEEMAAAAGVAAQTLLDIEKAKGDPHLSTLFRLAFVAGYEVDIRLRRVKRAPYSIRGNSASLPLS